MNRRNVLKSLSAAGIAASTPVVLHAATKKQPKFVALYADAGNIKCQTTATNAIVNHSDSPLVLNSQQPISFKDKNGQITTIHINSSEPVYTLQPGERLHVYAKAELINSPDLAQVQNDLIENKLAIV